MIDFLIIGGGIAGISAAARLSALGEVLVLEQEDALGFHASGRSAAMFLENYGNDVVCALNVASHGHHISAHGGVLSPRGLMILGQPGQEDAFAEQAAAFELDALSPAEAAAIVPIVNTDTITHAGLNRVATDLDTDKLLQDFRREALANGARIATRARVTELTKPGAWHVRAGTDDYTARILVNAAGAWVDQIAGMAGIAPLGFQPYRRSMARIPAPGGHDVSAWPMLHDAASTWYAKPDAGKFLVSPSEEDPMEPHDAYADDMVLAEGLARYEAAVTTPVTRLETSWAGLRTFAPDRALVLGFDPKDSDFLWCAGQGGYGFQTAPAASNLIADIVAGRGSELPRDVVAALSPARFVRVG